MLFIRLIIIIIIVIIVIIVIIITMKPRNNIWELLLENLSCSINISKFVFDHKIVIDIYTD